MGRWRDGDGAILALDLGTHCGWAMGDPGTKPKFGLKTLGGEGATHDERWHHLREWFMDMTAFDKPWAVCVESALEAHVAVKSGQSYLIYTYGLHAIVREAAIARGIALVRTVDVDDHRRHFIGHARPRGGGKEAKRMAYARCHQIGWKVQDHNVAEACAVWDYACSIWAPKTAAQAAIMAMAGGAR